MGGSFLLPHSPPPDTAQTTVLSSSNSVRAVAKKAAASSVIIVQGSGNGRGPPRLLRRRYCLEPHSLSAHLPHDGSKGVPEQVHGCLWVHSLDALLDGG